MCSFTSGQQRFAGPIISWVVPWAVAHSIPHTAGKEAVQPDVGPEQARLQMSAFGAGGRHVFITKIAAEIHRLIWWCKGSKSASWVSTGNLEFHHLLIRMCFKLLWSALIKSFFCFTSSPVLYPGPSEPCFTHINRMWSWLQLFCPQRLLGKCKRRNVKENCSCWLGLSLKVLHPQPGAMVKQILSTVALQSHPPAPSALVGTPIRAHRTVCSADPILLQQRCILLAPALQTGLWDREFLRVSLAAKDWGEESNFLPVWEGSASAMGSCLPQFTFCNRRTVTSSSCLPLLDSTPDGFQLS